MKKNTVFIILLCLLSTLWSCRNFFEIFGEDFDEETEEFNPEKGKYYLFENEYPSDYEWDWQIFKDDTLMSVKDDTLCKQILCRIGSATNVNDCLIYKTDYDGNIITYGTIDSLYSVTYYDDKIAFFRVNGDEIILKEFPMNRESVSFKNSQHTSRAINWINTLNNMFDIKSVYDGGKAISEGRLKKFATNATIFAATKPLPPHINLAFNAVQSLVYEPLVEADNSTKRTFLYGNNVSVEISSINETTPGNLTIKVIVSGINSIRKNIKLNLINDVGACMPRDDKNYISLAVLCRKDFTPITNEYDYTTYEVPINLEGQDEQTFTLTLPKLKGGDYYLRPYLRSVAVFKDDINPDLVIYGTPYNFVISSINITGTNPKQLVYDYTSQKLTCTYSVEVEKNIGDMPGKTVSGYGIYEYDFNGNKKIYPLVNEGTKTKGYVQISENPEGVEYDYKNYTGTIEKRFGTYIATINNSYIDDYYIQDTIFFYENNYTLTFQMEKPTIDITDVRLIDRRYVFSTDNLTSSQYPINGSLCEYEIDLVCLTEPFGYVDAFRGGDFYEIRGGTSANPTLQYRDIQNIAWIISNVSKDRKKCTYKVHVVRRDNTTGIGKNPIYLGFGCKFTDTDSLICNECVKFNYVGTPLLDFEGAYSNADIVTEKVPDFKLIKIFPQEK